MMELTEILQIGGKTWIIKIVAVMAATLLITFITDYSFKSFEKKLSYNKTIWDNLIMWALRMPLKFLIWILSVIFIIKIISSHIGIDIFDELDLSKNLGIISCLAWLGLRIVKKYEELLIKTGEKRIVGTISLSIITRLLKTLIIVISGLMLMQEFGVSIGGIIALGGIGGIAVGFAAKDLLANFFGTLMLYFDNPFSIGDYISSPDRKIEGTVEHIGWRLTHVQISDKSMAYIPNSLFSTIIVETIKAANQPSSNN